MMHFPPVSKELGPDVIARRWGLFFWMNFNVDVFEYPDFEMPPFPANHPTPAQITEWMETGNPLGEHWYDLQAALRQAAGDAYSAQRRAAFEAFKATTVVTVAPIIAAPVVGQPAGAVTAPVRTERPAPIPCPTIITAAQVAYFDNGKSERAYDADGKRTNGGGQHKLVVDAYTVTNFNLHRPTWSSNVLLRSHREIRTALRKSPNAYTPEYRTELTDLLKQTAHRKDYTWVGLFWDRRNGVHYHAHQYVVLELEHGDVGAAWLHLGSGVAPIRLVFDRAKCDGRPFALPNCKAQARFDLNKARPNWGNC